MHAGCWQGRRSLTRRSRVATACAIPLALALTLSACDSGASREAAVPRWTLEETLRIGSEDEGPTLFSWVKGIESDSLGRLFVYEQTAQEIRVFSADGAFLTRIGRRGSGPGELKNAEGIYRTRDGRLWLRDAANARLSVFDGEGVFQASWPMTFCSSQGRWDPKEDDSGRLLDEDCMVVNQRAQGNGVFAYHRDMSRVDTLGERPACGTTELAESATWITRTKTGTSYRQVPFAARAVWSIDNNGFLWCVPKSSRYEVLRISNAAKDTLRVVRELPPIPVTAEERAATIASFEENGPSGLDFSRIPSVKPMIDRVVVDPRNRIWVQRANGAGGYEFDVFSADGRLLAIASLPRAKLGSWLPFTVRGDHVYTVDLGTDDVPAVVRYRIVIAQ